MFKSEVMRKLGKNIYYRTRKLTRYFQDFRGKNNRRQILFNVSGSLSRDVISSAPGSENNSAADIVRMSKCFIVGRSRIAAVAA